jgi:general secretion pathway protein D
VRLNDTRILLYSPEFHESEERGRLATGVSPDCSSYSPPIAAYRHLFSAKEAHSIGMTRGYSSLFSISFRSRILSAGLLPGGFVALLVLLAGLASAPSARAQSAGTWNKRGQAAELRQDYDAAYEAYLRAHQKSPKDMRYTTRVDRMRFQAGASHVDRGRVLRQGGDVNGALNEFTRALQIDPSNETAAQEIQLTQHQQIAPPGPGVGTAATPPAPSASADVLREIGGVSGPIQLKPLSNDLVTVKMVEDTKVIYTAIGKQVGLNVLFDPEFQSKRIPVDLDSVSYTDALRVVGLISGTFYKTVTPDTIFIATNNPQKHTDLDDLVIQTFYLTNMSQPSDANEIQTAIRNVMPPDTKIYLVPSQNALILRGTVDQIMLAEKLINDLDRPKSEVVVDVAILEVNRDKIRTLGITLPQSFGLTPQQNPNSATAASATVTNNGTASTPTTSGFTLNSLANTNATNFAVTLSGGTLSALLSDADTRVLQNPSIRATDGQRAAVKVGSKIPYATGSYSAGAATGITAGIGVQTQFQYLDVGVNIEMTPTVHLDHEVSLKEKIEVTSQTGSVTISTVTEPIISQRTSDGSIQLKDGEPCLLAGILTKEDNRTNSGTPGLAEIPLIKYLFGTQSHEVEQDEIVFILIPHIVRESPLSRLNTRAIDTGTSKEIEIRQDTSAALVPELATIQPTAPGTPTSAANAAAAMVQQMKQAALPPTPPMPGSAASGNPGAAQVASSVASVPSGGQAVTYTVLPANSSQTTGGTFQVAVMASNAQDLYSVPLQVQFDSKILQLVNVDNGGLLSLDGQTAVLVHRDEGNGLVTISTSRPPGVAGVNGQGNICTLTFKAIAAGDSNIALVKVGAKNSKQASLPAVGSQAVVHVK